MSRSIPGARFIAAVFGGAMLCGGAAAMADALQLDATYRVEAPAGEPSIRPAAPVFPKLSRPDKAREAASAAFRDAAAAPDAAPTPARRPLPGVSAAPRLRPSPPQSPDADPGVVEPG